MTADLLFVGDASWDITLSVAHVPKPDEKLLTSTVVESAGGVAANAAVAAHCNGSRSRALVAVGSDVRGGEVVADLERAGIEVVTRRRGQTTLAVMIVDPGGEKRLVLYPGSSMYPTTEAVNAVRLSGTSWVHTAIYDIEASALLIERCREQEISWSIDLEPATFRHGIDSLADHLDGAAVVFCNDAAASALGSDAVGVLIRLGVRAVVRTGGARGADLHRPGEATTSIQAPFIDTASIIDTTGAGDCLAGWFVAELAFNTDPVTALRRAVTAASLSCRGFGGLLSYPDPTAVRNLSGESSVIVSNPNSKELS